MVGTNEIVCAEVREYLATLPDACVDLVLTSQSRAFSFLHQSQRKSLSRLLMSHTGF